MITKFHALYQTRQFIVLFTMACGPKRIKFKVAISIFILQISHAFVFIEVRLVRTVQFERNGQTKARMKCLQFQQFVSKRIKFPDSPVLVTAAKGNRTCTCCRIISFSAMHLFWHGNLIISRVYISPSATNCNVINAPT